MGQVAPAIYDLASDLVNYVGINGMQVRVNGGSSVNDGLSADYIWIGTSTATHDGINVIKATVATTGRWIKRTIPAASNIPIANLSATDLVPLTQRIGSTITASTITVNVDTTDQHNVTNLAESTTITAPTGTPLDGQSFILRIKDNGTARGITWNAIYRTGSDFALPITTVATKTLYIQFLYNSTDTRWDAVGLTSGL